MAGFLRFNILCYVNIANAFYIGKRMMREGSLVVRTQSSVPGRGR